MEHLFDSRGNFIAFRRGQYVWNAEGEWIGWLPWGDGDVVTPSGDYLGTIAGNRLYRRTNWLFRGHPEDVPVAVELGGGLQVNHLK